jgi:hypothetical protein
VVVLRGEAQKRSRFFRTDEFDLIEDFNFPTKRWAVISGESKSGVTLHFMRIDGFPANADYKQWRSSTGITLTEDTLRANYTGFSVKFEGIDTMGWDTRNNERDVI